MDKIAQFAQELKKLTGGKDYLPLSAEVTALDNSTCTIKLEGGLELDNVRLRATVDDHNSYYQVTPKVGSKVLVLKSTEGLESLYVVKVNEVQSFEVKLGKLEFFLDADDSKMSIKNNGTSMFDLMGEIKSIIGGLTVSTPSGPSGTPLTPTVAALNTFETNFKKLLK